MKNYRVNKTTANNPHNNHEVHNDSCSFYNLIVSYEYLGSYTNCQDAITEAIKRGYSKVDGCMECCDECHKA